MAEDLRTDAKGPVDFSRLSDIVFHGVYWLLSIHLLLLVGLFVICLWNSWMSVAVCLNSSSVIFLNAFMY